MNKLTRLKIRVSLFFKFFFRYKTRIIPSANCLADSGPVAVTTKPSVAIGIDYLGIERNQSDHETHLALLQKDIPIIEDSLRLGPVNTGAYILTCLPLAISGIDAALARAILQQL